MEPAGRSLSLIFDCLVHALILATVLTVIYWAVLSQIEVNAFKSEIDSVVNGGVADVLTQYDVDGQLKVLINENEAELGQLQAIYSQPDVRQTTNNNWLFVCNIIVLSALFCLLFTYYVCVRYVAQKDLNALAILKQNAVVFMVVGGFEVAFILNYVVKTAPVLPSTVTTYSLNEVKTLLFPSV